MDIIDQIHQKLETMDLTPFEKRDLKPLVEQAFRAGFTRALEKTDPLVGYSNLTAAISAGEPIDWERLDGLKVQCVNPDIDTLRGKLVRDDVWPADSASGWVVHGMGITDITAWHGDNGWTLWVEGEIPLRRKTADQLETGHFFTGKLPNRIGEYFMCVAGESGYGKHVRYAADLMPSQYPASEWEVITDHGHLQEPEGK